MIASHSGLYRLSSAIKQPSVVNPHARVVAKGKASGQAQRSAARVPEQQGVTVALSWSPRSELIRWAENLPALKHRLYKGYVVVSVNMSDFDPPKLFVEVA